MASGNNRRRILTAVVAGLIALGAFALVFTQLNVARTPAPAAGTAPTSQAVVALVDINVGDQLSAANLTVTAYPSAALPAAGLYYASTQPLTSASWYSTAKIPRGQPVLATQLSQVLVPEKLPPVQLTDGSVAMSVPYDETKDAAGFIQQDDFVDILVDDPTSKSVHFAFQGVHVLRVGDRASQPVVASPAAAAGAAPVAASVLLIELPRQQAAALAYAIDQGFAIRYLIRPHDQQSQQSLPNSGPVGQGNWLTVISS
ncbi:MAG TPA: Flp pilus assembly protein CpaB [Candidatus Dormibacteraeota bacterium]|jgi:Flp pilus assembly protein CpaB|nr:Flp pilus assembly protein CpaB [Candidatus Dormibacteraeota bacterium]